MGCDRRYNLIRESLTLKFCLFLFISFCLAQLAFAEAPPSLPMEIWGRAIVDGNTVDDGVAVQVIINSRNYPLSAFTEAGYFDVIIADIDSPLTYIDDSNCSVHWSAGETCIPCSEEPLDHNYCIEGLMNGDNVRIKIGDNELEEIFSLDGGNVLHNDVSIISIIQISKELKHGWNLFSLPVELPVKNIPDVLSSISGNYVIVWTTVNGNWKSDIQIFSPITEIVPERSYLIYMTEDDVLNISGKKFDTTNRPTIDIVPGWNLIGYPSLTKRNIRDVLSGVNYYILWSTVNGNWKSDIQIFSPLSQMEPMSGYMIYANSGGSFQV